jgi:hypothetical protein
MHRSREMSRQAPEFMYLLHNNRPIKTHGGNDYTNELPGVVGSREDGDEAL